ncbi:MAG: hypothetical protein A3B03_02690 [Candidatus Zambryskibacteria bacterium RIFCSPLOWO2_01_FULL_42_41]|nr:MAG: hypothetical protein A3B03_02690 [Candidatus Zambryskibacteria bacterium RIFCSPLOWO2_01_FULL_42_41]
MQRSKKWFWAAVALETLSLAAVLGFGWLTYVKMSTASKIISEAETKIAALEQKERGFAASEANTKDLAGEITLLESSFLSEGSFVKFIELLEGAARKTGVKFSAQNARLPASAKEKADLTFEITGNFRAVFNFISLLDRVPYAGLVESVAFSPKIDQGQKRTGEVTAKVNYIIFNYNL